MKKIFKYSWLMLSVVAAVVACKDDDTTAPGVWDANPNYANIYFENTTQAVELDPTADTKATIPIYRRDTIGARTVHMDVMENTDEVFTVGDAVFEDGDSVAYIEVTFPNAEIGKTYTLTLSSSDPDLVSSYSKDISYTLNVTRIKWNLAGKGTLREMFVFGGEGTFDLYVRDDDPTQFRFDNMFDEIAANTETTLDGNQTQQAFVSILKKGDVLGSVTVSQANLVGFKDDLNTGFMHPTYGADILICHPYGFSSTASEDKWSYNKVLGYQENGLPTQIQIAPFYYMNGVGGWNYTQREGYVIITFPGYTPVVTYEAYFNPFDESDDFQWTDVKTFDLTNSKTGEVSNNIMLQKATCTVDTDDCDSVFLANYGVPYCIKNAFVEGYDLYFFVKSGKIIIPADFEDYFWVQETGLATAPLNTSIYAMLNSDACHFNTVETEEGIDITDIILNISFTDEDGATDFGTADIILNNVTWTEIGTGTYTYLAMFDEPTPDEGLPFSKRDDKDDIFKISHWFYDVDFQFTWDKETNQCSIPAQYTGLSYDGYGDVWVSDVVEFTGNEAYYELYPCTYDPATATFCFNPIYFIVQNPNQYRWMGDDPETFMLDAAGVKAQKAPLVAQLNLKNTRSILKRKSIWKGVKLAQPYSSKPCFERFTR